MSTPNVISFLSIASTTGDLPADADGFVDFDVYMASVLSATLAAACADEDGEVACELFNATTPISAINSEVDAATFAYWARATR